MTGVVNMMLGASPFRASAGPGGEITSIVQDAAAQAGLLFSDDGYIYEVKQGIPAQLVPWVDPVEFRAVSGWTVEFELVSGSVSSGTTDSPLALTSDRAVGVGASPPGTQQAVINAVVALGGVTMAQAQYEIGAAATES